MVEKLIFKFRFKLKFKDSCLQRKKKELAVEAHTLRHCPRGWRLELWDYGGIGGKGEM